MVRNDAFALFVGELQDVHLTARRQCIFHLFAQRIHLRLTGAKLQSARTRARLLSGLTLFSPLRWSCHTCRWMMGRNGSINSSTSRMA
jgi:hypothetical protein